MAYLSGKSGKVIVGSTTWHVKGWNFTMTSGELDVTDSNSAGYRKRDPGLSDGNGSVTAVWDDSINYNSAPNITVGTQATLKLYINTTEYFEVPAMVTSWPVASTVDGQVAFTISFAVNGAWTEPT